MPSYSIDASAILDAWVRHYPIDTFPSFWERFADLGRENIAIASELIGRELGKKDDGCLDWFHNNGLQDFFVDIDDNVQEHVVVMMQNPSHQRLVDDRKGMSGADPFVIGLAQAQNLVVVTGEKPTNSTKRPKIPDVCRDLGITCISVLELMRKEGWQF